MPTSLLLVRLTDAERAQSPALIHRGATSARIRTRSSALAKQAVFVDNCVFLFYARLLNSRMVVSQLPFAGRRRAMLFLSGRWVEIRALCGCMITWS